MDTEVVKDTKQPIEIKVLLRGYWRDCDKNKMPAKTGIYVVYRSSYNEKWNYISLKEIIYIGKAENVRERVTTHDKLSLFNTKLKEGEELCYSFGQVEKDHLDIVENALIYAQQPDLNTELRDNYTYDATHITLDGTYELMKYKDFTIYDADKYQD